MATTKKKLAEQIQRIYARFLDKENIVGTEESFDDRELYPLIEQSINKNLKAETFLRFQDGYVDIPRCNIIKYTAVSTVADASHNRAYCEIPAIPLSLPMDMGVWQINQTGNPHNPYIPIGAQDWGVMRPTFSGGSQDGGLTASFLEQQVGYYVEGKRIYFTKDIKTDDSVDTVEIQLLVNDMAQYSLTDLLPVNPEVEAVVISEVLSQISGGRFSQAELGGKTENDKI